MKAPKSKSHPDVVSAAAPVAQAKASPSSHGLRLPNAPDFQALVNESPHVQHMHALQRKVDHSPLQAAQVVQLLGTKRTRLEAFGEEEESEYEPPKKRRKFNGIERLKRSNRRNRNKKARPKRQRSIFDHQAKHNYGYEEGQIAFGDVKGGFRPGFGGQPFFALDKSPFAVEKTPLTNYDSIVAAFDGQNQPALATAIMDNIEHGTAFPVDLPGGVKANMSLMVQLTQIIEPHNSRIPGIDKLARSFFREIAAGNLTFQAVFNRKDGHFVVARAKAAKATYGGQESGRSLLGLAPKKSDKAKSGETWNPIIDHASGNMSDSSDEEDL